MKRMIIIPFLAALMILWAYSAMATDNIPQMSQAGNKANVEADITNVQTATSCNFCYTCGGDWPIFAGSIRSYGDTPYERGSGCSGPLTSTTDYSPYLCCR